jgi:hypothetical protein
MLSPSDHRRGGETRERGEMRVPLAIRIVTVIIVMGAIGVRRAILSPHRTQTIPSVGGPAWYKDWQQRLRAPRLDANQFTELFAEAVRARVKGSKVTISEPLTVQTTLANGMSMTSNLDNAWAEARNSPADRVAICERFLRVIPDLPLAVDDGQGLSGKKIVPVIKDCGDLEVTRKMPVKAEHLVADLWIVYAYDRPESLSFVRAKDPGAIPQLHQQAIRYLRQVLPPIERHGRGPCYMLTAGGTFEASLLLLDEIWQEQEKAVEGELVAAVPARDMLIFTGSHSQTGMAALREIVQQTMEHGSYTVSSTLLVRRHGHWEEYR